MPESDWQGVDIELFHGVFLLFGGVVSSLTMTG